MGFLKFLNREKKKESSDELDLPPSPPPLGDFEENLPPMDINDGMAPASKEEFPKEDFPEFSDFGFPEIKDEVPPIHEDLPNFPDYMGTQDKFLPPTGSPASSPRPQSEIAKPSQIPQQLAPANAPPATPPLATHSDIYSRPARKLFTQERNFGERRTAKTIYIKVEKFKEMLGGINLARNYIRKSEETLVKLENLKSTKDRSFDKMKVSLDDLQKKLIFIDKTLFKGD